MVVDIDKIIVKDRIRKDFGDLQELADDIKENGIINPPVINKDYVLVAGERRLRALKMLGYEQIEVRMMDTTSPEHELNVEISENEVRKAFSKAERASYMKELMKIEAGKAKERQEAGVRPKKDEGARSDETVAKQFDIGKNTLRKEIAIVDNRDKLSVEDFADWDEGKLSTNKAFQKIKAENERLKAETENFAALSEMIPELSELVDTGMVSKSAALAVLKELDANEQEQLIADLDVTHRITGKEIQEAIKDMKADYDDLEEQIKEKNEQITEKKQTIKDLQDQIASMNATQDERKKMIVDASLVFCSRADSFLRDVGGYVWLTDSIKELPEADQEVYRRAIDRLGEWIAELNYKLNNTQEVIVA